MGCLSYLLSCFFKKEQQTEITNPLHKSFDSCETVDRQIGHQYIDNNNITIITTPKRVHFSNSITDD